MSVPVIAFFNNKGGVGKTTLVYHVAWMLKHIGYRVLVADLDPQSNLTTAFIEEDSLELLWGDESPPATIYDAVQPLQKRTGDILEPAFEKIAESLVLIPGDMRLSTYEDLLSQSWPLCLADDEGAFRVTSAFWRVMQNGACSHGADVILMDLGPNLGSINRAALISSDFVVIPLGPDLFSLQGLQNLGPCLRKWRSDWSDRSARNPSNDLELPAGKIQPIGYIVMQHSERLSRPVKSYQKWIARIPGVYRKCVLNQFDDGTTGVADDENCFSLLKHYRSLMPMAQESRKPIFSLKPADGALGAHTYSVQDAYEDFETLAREILRRAQVGGPRK